MPEQTPFSKISKSTAKHSIGN